MKKKSKKWLIWTVVILIPVVITAVTLSSGSNDEENGRATVKVTRENIVEQALAVGSIEPVTEIDVKSKVSGVVGKLYADVGDPVVPLTPYQPGTAIMRMADMNDLIFKGTVDEIDVGKIREGMSCDLQVGAIPGQNITGHVILISLKAKKEDNTTVFPVEIKIDQIDEVVLRAGYSANAHIIIAKRDSVLSIPERVVTFRNDSAFVEISAGPEKSEDVYIKTGLSDAIQIEVLEGLEEGQEVLEKKVQEIT